MKRMNILFDASVLALDGAREHRTGIFFVVLNILKEMQNREEVSLCLYFSSEKIYEGKKICEKLSLQVSFCQKLNKIGKCLGSLRLSLFSLHRKYYRIFVVRKFSALGIFATNCLLRLKIGCTQESLSTYDAFISPLDAVPKEIRHHKVKSFLFLHDAIPLVLDYLGPERKRLYEKLVDSFLPGDSFFCVSRSTLTDFSKFSKWVNEKSAMVLPLAANQKFIPNLDNNRLLGVKRKYNIPEEKRFVFSLCAVEPRKNLVRAVTSFLTFLERNKIDDVVWVLGGASWDSFVDILNEKKKNWDSTQVIYAGYIDDEDLPILYSNALWFVYTSQYEGFGLPPLEAMQCGCPVIVSNNSSLPEVVGDAGLLIDWDSGEQHIAAYEKYYYNDCLRKEYSCKGIERAKMFSWEKTAKKMLEFVFDEKSNQKSF